MAGLTCSFCGEAHGQGSLVCRQCGRDLVQRSRAPRTADPAVNERQQPGEHSSSAFSLAFPWGSLRLDRGEDLTIGRGHPPVDAHLTEYPNVSKDHARIVVREAVSVTDLNSSNGTYVDGEKIPPGVARGVKPGQVLSFSKTLEVRLVAGNAGS